MVNATSERGHKKDFGHQSDGMSDVRINEHSDTISDIYNQNTQELQDMGTRAKHNIIIGEDDMPAEINLDPNPFWIELKRIQSLMKKQKPGVASIHRDG